MVVVVPVAPCEGNMNIITIEMPRRQVGKGGQGGRDACWGGGVIFTLPARGGK